MPKDTNSLKDIDLLLQSQDKFLFIKE